MLPRLVDPARLSRANTVDAMTFNGAAVAGPALAGALAGALGAARGALALVAVAVAGLVATLLLPLAAVVRTEDGARAAGGLLADVRAGLRQLAREPSLRAATLTSSLAYGCTGALGVALPLFTRALGAGEDAAGWLWGALELGALVGAAVLARGAVARAPALAVIAGTAVFGLAMMPWSFATTLPVALALVALAGLLSGPVLPALFAVRQRGAPPGLLAQVSMTAVSLKIGFYAVGAALGGWLVPAAGPRRALLLVAAGQLVSAALGGVALVWRSRAAAEPC
jgi:hypothetical protein